jgi:mannose-6-phosphate isomerase-like protein (cupin superfamily)
MNYTHENLCEIIDVAVQYGYADHQEARLLRGELGASATGLARLRIKPRRREPFAHRHRRAEEMVVVLSGTGRVKPDNELVDLSPRDAVRVGPGVTRALEAGDAGLEILVFGPHVENDVEIVDDFWGTR